MRTAKQALMHPKLVRRQLRICSPTIIARSHFLTMNEQSSFFVLCLHNNGSTGTHEKAKPGIATVSLASPLMMTGSAR